MRITLLSGGREGVTPLPLPGSGGTRRAGGTGSRQTCSRSAGYLPRVARLDPLGSCCRSASSRTRRVPERPLEPPPFHDRIQPAAIRADTIRKGDRGPAGHEGSDGATSRPRTAANGRGVIVSMVHIWHNLSALILGNPHGSPPVKGGPIPREGRSCSP